MRRFWFIVFLLFIIACTNNERVDERNTVIREQIDSLSRKTDSFNNKIEMEMDSAIQKIDSLLMELEKKKNKK